MSESVNERLFIKVAHQKLGRASNTLSKMCPVTKQRKCSLDHKVHGRKTGLLGPKVHWILGWFGLERTLKIIWFQHPAIGRDAATRQGSSEPHPSLTRGISSRSSSGDCARSKFAISSALTIALIARHLS